MVAREGYKVKESVLVFFVCVCASVQFSCFSGKGKEQIYRLEKISK